MAGDRWFCWEQPERDGFALATLGSAAEVVARGDGRFAELAASCAETGRDRLADEPDELPAAAGPVWVGGLAFAPDGAAHPHWSSFPPALLTLPEVSLVRQAGRTLLTVAPRGDAAPARLAGRIASLPPAEIPLADPHPIGRATISSVLPPSRYEAAVAGAVERIRA